MKPSADKAAGIALKVEGLRKSFGSFLAVRDVTFDVPAGGMIALIGPSGCGKTTTLRMIAGLERPDSGRIVAGDRVLVDGAAQLPPERRDLGMVFQSYALWPHMTVSDNIAYGLKRRGRERASIEAKVAEVLKIVGMTQFATRYPGQLSGGQQQRVALSRAIATEPGILLFDEPLSNLDAVLREQMRFEIRSLQQRLGITGVYVTHSQDEALAMSDRIAVMLDGNIVQFGAPTEIYNTPKSKFVAGFIGLTNLLALRNIGAEGAGLAGTLADGTKLRVAAGALAEAAARGSATISVRPAEIAIGAAGSAVAGRNVLRGHVRTTAFTGGLIDYFVTLADGTEIRVQTTPPAAAQPGATVELTFSPDRSVALLD
ncbi:MAG: ABC transporter ATP-binding protein [Alphaproteobacteria bacterium]|nr:ABC transporter ATP-binding protein [Alphaproteobacteria bacterium]